MSKYRYLGTWFYTYIDEWESNTSSINIEYVRDSAPKRTGAEIDLKLKVTVDFKLNF